MDMKPHQRGVLRAMEYLKQDLGRELVLSEVCPTDKIRIDAYGISANAPSVTVDWKNSMEDAKKHMQKHHVKNPHEDIGQYRYIACEPYIVEHESINYWPEWLGLVWLDGKNPARVQREALYIRKFNVMAERAMLATFALKGNYQQKGAVQRESWKDKAANLIGEDGPQRSKDIVRELGLSMPPGAVARDLDNDKRFKQNSMTLCYELHGEER